MTAQSLLSEKIQSLSAELANQVHTQECAIFRGNTDNKLSDTIDHICQSDLKDIQHLVVLGTGGSALGGMTLYESLSHPSKKVTFLPHLQSNALPKILAENLDGIGFLVISKSGSTLETLIQTNCVIQALLANKKKVNRHLFIITTEQNSALMDCAQEYHTPLYPHHPHIGGRYSCFSIVSLLPAAFAGFDIRSFLRGSQETLRKLSEKELVDHLNYMCLHSHETSMHINTVLCYHDELKFFLEWYKQLWSESIGKNSKGPAVLSAIGPLDQHSGLQLYLAGPKDKFFTLIHIDKSDTLTCDLSITPYFPDCLDHKSIANVIRAAYQATYESLSSQHPCRSIEFSRYDAMNLGQLMSQMIIETILSCRYSAVNPYDQPAVEQGKKRIKELLSISCTA